MTAAMTNDEHIKPYRDQAEALADRLAAGPERIRALRASGLARFEELGFPGPRDEEWRYMRLRPIAEAAYRPALAEVPALDEAEIAGEVIDGLDAHRLVFVNGVFNAELSHVGDLPDGVVIDSLARVLADDPAFADRHLARYAGIDAHAFTALNAAFIADGAVVFVPKGVALEKPVHLLFHAKAGADAVVCHPRTLIVAEDGASVSVVEHFAGVDGQVSFTNAVSEVKAAAGASVAHYRIQQQGDAAYHIHSATASLDEGAHYTAFGADLGGGIVRNGLDVDLAGLDARATLDGLFVVGGRQQVDNHTRIDHHTKGGVVRQRYKGIAGGHARGVFNGKILVHPGAVKTDAEMSSKNILLSRDAELFPKPELEIYADDVKCAHGATVGSLSRDELFYLRARGLDEELSRRILTRAFAQEIVDGIAIEPLRAFVDGLLDRAMARGLLEEDGE